MRRLKTPNPQNITDITPEVLWDIEKRLSQPLFFGMPVGPTLNNVLNLDLYLRRGDWSRRGRCKNRIRYIRNILFPLGSASRLPVMPAKRILVTWTSADFRMSELVLPIICELGGGRCLALCRKPDMISKLPPGTVGLALAQVLRCDRREWRTEFRRCWPELSKRLDGILEEYHLPNGVYDRLAACVVSQSKYLLAALRLLQRCSPAAVLTEHDRNLWTSTIVLAAKRLGVPAYTLVHGVLNEKALGYVPLLADKAFCWGEIDRAKFIAAGTNPDRLLIGGCPRLSRDLPLSAAEARRKLGLPEARPVAMLATSPMEPGMRDALVSTFSEAMESLPGVSAIVRLHPVESLRAYSRLASRYPKIHIFDNHKSSLDESLAASTVVVVHSSGVGSDALVKRRLAVLLDILQLPLGHGEDLIQHADCPRARSVEELKHIIKTMVNNKSTREALRDSAEAFVRRFCKFYGQDSARRIAKVLLNNVGGDTPANRIQRKTSGIESYNGL